MKPRKREGLREQKHGSATYDDIRCGGRQSRIFPGHLAKTGREEIISVLEAAGARAIVVLGPEESRHGAVETYAESQRCAALFKKHAEEIDGIIVTCPTSARSAALWTPSGSPA
jgi:L-fucose isomerase-like protein